MEDLNASDVAQWVKAENAVTEKFLATLPMRERFRSRITELWNYPKVGLPFREANRLFYTKNSGLQKQSRLLHARVARRARADRHRPERALAGRIGRAQSVRSVARRPLPGVRTVAGRLRLEHGLCENAHRQSPARPTRCKWLKFSGLSWTKDGNGFFYSRFPTPEAGKELQSAVRDQKLYYHKLGTPQSSDRLIYERKDHPRVVRLRRR